LGNTKNSQKLSPFNSNLLFCKWYTNDIFGIWVHTPQKRWDTFEAKLNEFGNLKWNVKNLTTTTTFFYLQIFIQGNKIKTKTFQKPMNLLLYIPPISVHPHSGFKGLICGEILHYWIQNTEEKDYINVASLFIQRLLQRGHCLTLVQPLIKSVVTSSNPDETLYKHWKHHPNDIGKRTMQSIYDKTF